MQNNLINNGEIIIKEKEMDIEETKRMIDGCTFSIEEAAAIMQISPSTLKNACNGMKKEQLKKITFKEFEFEKLEEYQANEIICVVYNQNKKPIYRIFIHAIPIIINKEILDKAEPFISRELKKMDIMNFRRKKIEIMRRTIKAMRDRLDKIDVKY